MPPFTSLAVLLSVLCSAGILHAQDSLGYRLLPNQVRIERAEDWSVWDTPPGVQVVGLDGAVEPRFLRSDINVSLDAERFIYVNPFVSNDTLQGGVHEAGSNVLDGSLVLDGDGQTYWEPERVGDGGRRSYPFAQSQSLHTQFRVRLLEPGAKLERLVFEYSTRPLADELRAEISPLQVDAGVETSFVLSLQMRREDVASTGFRFLSVQTPAQLFAVDSVRVDDQAVVFTADLKRESGFDVNLWERVVQDGSFVQLFFRAAVFIDGTPFQVRVLDRRRDVESAQVDTVYQFAREGDVDPLSLGGSLAVRLRKADPFLVGPLVGTTSLLTPNGDGVNDYLLVSYDVLKLTRPAPVAFEIFSLDGRRIRSGQTAEELSGRHIRVWDGRDAWGRRVPPGTYLYRVRVEAGVGRRARAGIVSIVY